MLVPTFKNKLWKIFKTIASTISCRCVSDRGAPAYYETNTLTLTRFMIAEQKKIPIATGDFTELLNSIQTAVKVIDVAVRKAGLIHLFGAHGSKNVHGEHTKKLDVLANEVFMNMLISSYTVNVIVSEEQEHPIEIPIEKRGKYIVCYDPLDGSSNIDCLVSIGSIFGIYRTKSDQRSTMQDLLQQGRSLVAAGYALYGSATMIVLSTGLGVNGFMLDHAIGEFILTDPDIQIPARGRSYSVNEGHSYSWEEAIQKYVAAKKDPKMGTPYTARYVGSMVADIHRILKYGGIYMYPATAANPKGKLRLLYECNPMAFITEQAGGSAYDGQVPILNITPDQIHHRTPVFMGSKNDVEEFLTYCRKYPLKSPQQH